VENKRPENKRNVVVLVSTIAVLFIMSGIAMGIWSSSKMKEQVVRQFNEEQMVIAHSLSRLIERELGALKKEILILKEEVPDGNNPEELEDISRSRLSSFLERGVSSIDIVDLKKRMRFSHALYSHSSVHKEEEMELFGMPPEDAIVPESIWTSKPLANSSGMYMLLATSLAEDSSKLLLFNISLSWFLKPFFKDIRSGKTGYAWLIDEDGIFLFHPENDFMGKNAFKVREERDPDISYDMINSIQKDKMLKGQEGTGYYYSGWHRGITGKIRKLISYCPVIIDEKPSQIWSVAVVVPGSEIEEAVRSGYYRHFLLQSFMIATILLGAFTIIFFERQWSRNLEDKVKKRTRDLSKAQENYRSLVESADDFIFTVDSQGIFQSINSFTANFFGGTPEEFIGKDLSSIYPKDIEKLASMGTLAAGVAHEINNPLSIILGFCDLLLRNTVKNSRQYEDLKTIERQGLHCKQVVENLLSFARIGEGENEVYDLNQCLKEIIQVVAHTLEMKGIVLHMELSERQIMVKADSRELQQVFLNLINNAISSMDGRGGTLTVRTKLESKGERAVIQIQDEGVGIRKEDAEHIFEPFFTTKSEGEGTGLGLFVSYGIIKKYGGSIDFVSHTSDSSDRGGGTIFTIKLRTKRSNDVG